MTCAAGGQPPIDDSVTNAASCNVFSHVLDFLFVCLFVFGGQNDLEAHIFILLETVHPGKELPVKSLTKRGPEFGPQFTVSFEQVKLFSGLFSAAAASGIRERHSAGCTRRGKTGSVSVLKSDRFMHFFYGLTCKNFNKMQRGLLMKRVKVPMR